MYVRLAILLCIWIQLVKGGEVCCEEVEGCFHDDPPYSHLPVPDCFSPSFTLYHADNATPIDVGDVPENFDANRRTIFVVHGYRGDTETSDWMHTMKDELLINGNYNVILVDWGKGSKALWYPQSAANIRVTAHQIARLSDDLIGRGLARSNLYCVGHSLGGHTCGHVGKIVRFGRITGLDPAGPMFESYPEEARLQPSDADYVDVIHTMGDEGFIMDFGTLVPLGHADFYPNGGGDQPGCVNRRRRRRETEPAAHGEGLGCSHGRAIDYFIESINSPCFVTSQVCQDHTDIPNSCAACGDSCQSMGFTSEHYSTVGRLYVETNSQAPFCRG